ncbi:MAG: lysophospholipid acyltransferase family protein [Candidatus Omnitrophica bacterium]|nr:lysophospholipid acyltransferase family protein [Candidatus Omnitrophota bacterium]
MFFYTLYRIGYFLANVFSLKIAYWLADRFSDIHYAISKKDREAVTQNLSKVLAKDIDECRVFARKVFRSFGLYMVDFFRMQRLDKDMLKKMIRVVGIENLDNVLKQNRGVIALSCHIGNWELGGVAIAKMGYDISAVVLTHRYKKINDFFTRQREGNGMKVISIHSVMKKCVSTLLNKKILALVGDRNFTNSGVMLDFFGVPTSIPNGPVALSSRTNSPIVPVFCIRENRFNYKLIFDKPIEIEKASGSDGDGAIREASKKIIPVMEKYIRAYPEQWLVFRRFWEKPEDAFVV